MPRQHSQYDGQVSAPFTVLAEFEIRGQSALRFVFDTWISTANFDADGNPIQRLQRTVEAGQAFVTANQTVLGQLRSALFTDANIAGRGFDLDHLQHFPVQKVLTFRAKHPTSGEEVFRAKRGASHDAFVTANAQLFDDLNAAVWSHAKANDQFLNAMTPAV